MTIIPLYKCSTSSLSSDGQLGCFPFLAIVNSAAMNTEVYLSCQSMVFYGYMLRSGTAGSYGSSIFSFSYIFSLRTAQSLGHV